MVQGLRGERQAYQPVRSALVAGCDPLTIARALCGACGGKVVYIADLDAIAGTGDHLETVGELADGLGVEPWVDAGVSGEEAAARLLEAGAARVIVGTETLSEIGALRALRGAVPAGQLIVSLDVGAGGVISRCPSLRGRAPLEALEVLVAEGVEDVILLALTHVGTGAGPDAGTLRAGASGVSAAAPGRGRRRARPRGPASPRGGRRRRRAARDRASSRLDHAGRHPRRAVGRPLAHQRAVRAGTSPSKPPSVRATNSDAAMRSAVVPGFSA